MAKYEEVYEDIQDIFQNLIKLYEIDNNVTIKVLSDNRMKKIGKLVKANPLVQHLAGVDLVIVINESIFEQLTLEQQNLQAEELLAGVSWDMEKDRLVVNKGDINTYSGILNKYSYEQYEVLQESIKTLYAVEESGENG